MEQGLGRVKEISGWSPKILSFAKVVEFPAPTIIPWAKRVNASVLNGSFKINFFRYGS